MAVSSKDGLEVADPRNLTPEEIEKLQKEECISDYKKNKLESEARKNWDLFYKRNSTNFFKDRHWLTREFPELVEEILRTTGRTVLLEAGCGVGNAIFPLLQEYHHLFIYACDFSSRAVEYVKENPLYSDQSCKAFQCDLTKDSLVETIPKETVNLVSLIFVLSAISPAKMADTIQNLNQVLKPGGCVLLRDYGLYDHAMLRFGRGHKIQDHFYMRQDGTRAYFFSIEELKELFGKCGFVAAQACYVHKETVNHKENISAPRVFVQGKFVKKEEQQTGN